MSLFRRRKNEDDVAVDLGDGDELVTDEEGDDDGGGRGPWDVEDEPELGGRIDLGAVRVPARRGMAVRMELEKTTRRVVAVNVALESSALQIQAFAAPRTEGLWDDLRGEIAESIGKQGGSVDERTGPFGPELLARLPVRTPDGRSGHRPARFLGVDGPRWFLRGVLTGKAAVEAEEAVVMEAVFADVVVVRGSEARAPRDLLTLHLPGKPGEVVPETGARRPDLDVLRPRGPEITEVR